MYEKILVPLDGSILAEVALPYAEELAGRLGSEIILLSMAESTEAEDYHKRQIYISGVLEEARHHVEEYLEKPEGKAIKVEAGILVGDPAEEIVDYADRENISLIVMAAHGQSGIRRWAMGGVADKVVRAARKPVALIRAKGGKPAMREKGMLNKVLVLLDGSKESEAVLPYVEELASKLQTEVILLQVVGKPYRLYADAEGYLENVAGLLKDKGVNVKPEVRVGSAAEEIIKLADEVGTDMVAMTTHGRSGIGRWAIGSVAGRVLRWGNTPVLLVRTPGASTFRMV